MANLRLLTRCLLSGAFQSFQTLGFYTVSDYYGKIIKNFCSHFVSRLWSVNKLVKKKITPLFAELLFLDL